MKIRIAVALAVATAAFSFAESASAAVPKIATGNEFTCVLDKAGTVKCTGTNRAGQLGDGTNLQRSIPVPVVGLTNATKLSVGGGHACAVLSDGSARCWGSGSFGALGNGSDANSNVPVMPVGLSSGVTDISAGRLHTCAVVNGAAKCWGAGSSGQVGQSDYVAFENLTPRSVSAMTDGVTAVSAGYSHSCGIRNGKVWCWGANHYGQLGFDTASGGYYESAYGGEVQGITGATAVAAGKRQGCAIAGGALRCWGDSDNWEIGAANYPKWRNVPMPISGPVTDVSASTANTCAIGAGAVSCWGANDSKQLGNISFMPGAAPVTPPGMGANASSVSTSTWNTCAIISAQARCWGYRGEGGLGDGTYSSATSPQPVPSITSGATDVATGAGGGTCVVQSGGVKCWGSAQPGDGSNEFAWSPVAVGALGGTPVAIAVGGQHACALVSNAVKCWGKNEYGQIGDGSVADRLTPTATHVLTSGVTQIATNLSHSCAIASGGAKCWGRNDVGQIGDGTSGTDRTEPVDVTGLTTNVTSVAVGIGHSCAVQSGAVKCWGDNTFGQLGVGDSAPHSGLVTPTGLTSGVDSVVAFGHRTCAKLTSGDWRCWNQYLFEAEPAAVGAIPSTGASVSVGADHACRIVSEALGCWGMNDQGMVGTGQLWGNTDFDVSPVPGLGAGVTKVAASNKHTCAIVNGGVQCWGTGTTFANPQPAELALMIGLGDLTPPPDPKTPSPPIKPKAGTLAFIGKPSGRLRALATRGLKVGVRTFVPVRFKLTAYVKANAIGKTRSSKLVPIAVASGKTNAPDYRTTVKVLPSSRIRKKLAKLKRLTITFRLQETRTDQSKSVVRKTVTLK
ncbi:MAG: hypothetical protein JHC98_07085 [Thermoleophilaceae bacterium]|nr:hypothetical protein [Thermoleophilaceae bacterium]